MRILVVHNHIVLPLAIAFGIASGVTPQQGLITAIVAGFIIAIFGGSRYLIGGPTGAFIVVIAGIIAKFGMADVAVPSGFIPQWVCYFQNIGNINWPEAALSFFCLLTIIIWNRYVTRKVPGALIALLLGTAIQL